jgi:hypothetical protein
MELWGCSSKSNITIMQGSQSKILRITNAPWYVTNQTLHEDLNVPYITEVIQESSNKHHDKIEIHSNTILWPLLEQQHRRITEELQASKATAKNRNTRETKGRTSMTRTSITKRN